MNFFLFSILMLPVSVIATDLTVNCKAIGGNRVDFQKETGEFTTSKDSMTLYDIRISLKPDKKTAVVTLHPTTKGKESGVDLEDYDADILHISDSMFSVKTILFAPSLPEKVELYTVYPILGVGFLSTVDAYMGNPKAKIAAENQLDIPEASAKTIPLSCRLANNR